MSMQTVVDALVAAGGNPAAALMLKATLAMAIALILIHAARGASASLRHLLAAASFGVLLLLPLAGIFVPERKITVAPAAETMTRPEAAALAPATSAGAAQINASTALTSAESGLPQIGRASCRERVLDHV